MMTQRHVWMGWLMFLFASVLPGAAQTCPDLIYPADGEVDVPVDASISWEDPGAVSGFIISIGTSPGGVDILTNRTSSAISGYTPETGLPEDTLVYVSFILILADGTQINCPGFSFRTAPFDSPPGCTQLLEPSNGATDVALGDEINWAYAPMATGYLLTILTSQGDTLASQQDVGNVLSFNPAGNFPANTDITVQITPYNPLGEAPGVCPVERFTTGESTIDCDPQRPSLSSLASVTGLCPDAPGVDLVSDGIADGYNWFRIEPDGSEVLVGTGSEVRVSETGSYILEAYNLVGSVNEFTVCSSYREYQVIAAAPPVIGDIVVNRQGSELRIEVRMASSGDYEFSLQPDSGFQDSPVFAGLPVQPYTVYVRGRQGCGFTQQEIDRTLGPSDFPPFFTPNSDGFNDRWKFVAPEDLKDAAMQYIRIFDRYGNFLIQLDRDTRGWDGNVRGQPVPASVYWYEALSLNQQVIRGYFALKR